jgi:hypothetical protein
LKQANSGQGKTGVAGTLQRAGNAIRARFGDTNEQVIDEFVQVKPEVIQSLGRLAAGGTSLESRANAARALGILRGAAALPQLIEAVHSKDTAVMFEALIAVQKIRDPSAGPLIAFRLKDLDEKVQVAAIETTGILRNREAAPQVRDVLEHAKTPKVRHAALTALSRLGDPNDHPTFLRYLSDKDEGMRAAACEGWRAWRRSVDRAVLDKFSPMSSHESAAFGGVALVRLGNLDNTDFAPLKYLVNAEPAFLLSFLDSALLTELARDAKVRTAIYPLLPRATKDEKIQLAIILARSGDRDSLQYLETLSVDPDVEVAQEGVRSLRTLRARLP